MDKVVAQRLSRGDLLRGYPMITGSCEDPKQAEVCSRLTDVLVDLYGGDEDALWAAVVEAAHDLGLDDLLPGGPQGAGE